jgi:hypothetical protein
LNLTLDKFVTKEMLEVAHYVADNEFERDSDRDSDGSEVGRLLMTNYIESAIIQEQV